LFVKFQAWLFSAKLRLSAIVEAMEPVVFSSESIKERRPVRMVATDQAGFQVEGWKEVMEVQIFLST
jgi:hypothetical protein